MSLRTPTRTQALISETHKAQVEDDVHRVYCTLSASSSGVEPAAESCTPATLATTAHRSRKALARLLAILRQKGLLTERELDDVLLAAVDWHEESPVGEEGQGGEQ